MGCLGVRVTQPDAIGDALRQALAAERPAVVEVMTGIHYRAAEPWKPAA
jgi:thiamine pyrophosphate-dependent acetolactate synthase large subunit-like protein